MRWTLIGEKREKSFFSISLLSVSVWGEKRGGWKTNKEPSSSAAQKERATFHRHHQKEKKREGGHSLKRGFLLEREGGIRGPGRVSSSTAGKVPDLRRKGGE